VLQDPLEPAVRRGAQGVVHLLRGDFLLQLGDEVYDGDVGGGDAHGHAADLPLHLREHQPGGLGGAGGGGDDGHGGGAGAAQVLVGKVENVLVVGVGVYGRPN